MNKAIFTSILVSASLTAACSPSTSRPSTSVPDPVPAEATPPVLQAIDQQHLCEVSGWQHDLAREHCKPGQKIVFLPDSWGNDQLPILFAAVNCDLRYSVALTKGAVTCIYAPIDVEPRTPATSPSGPVMVPPQS